ncbi:threonine--tRNA ligase [Balneolaceae bacterium ANBcel3]|nr:threonine--tRNA ligase [Balneolaceae bacterium ANBcel3]
MTEPAENRSEDLLFEFPDGSQRSFASGITGHDIAKSISGRLAREALSITVDDTVLDLHRPLYTGGTISINTWEHEDGKMAFWHSSAHVLAEAVEQLYPGVKLGIGPPIEQGFYYDIDFGDTKFGTEDLPAVEAKMIELARQKNTFDRFEISKEEALEHYKKKDDPYKLDLIEGLEDGTISFYKQGSFTDLCRGPHIPDTSTIKAVKLLNTAGAYWRGDNQSKQLTRIYGVSFPKKSMLDAFLHQLEEAKKRDHKKLGPQLGIYMIDRMVGSGLPMWLPNGTVLRRTLESFLREEQIRRGYQEVITPHIGNLELYKTSGHYPYYKDSQFAPMDVDDEGYLLKPMNCPHHHRIYDNEMRSYRDLPVRLAEFGTVYRYEQTGELNGLSRVRGFTQDDAHIYCSQEQLKEEIKNCIDLTQFVFNTFNMPVDIRLSFRDDNEKKYGGDLELWEQAQKDIREAADEMQLDYTIAKGEASFYGPKIDFIIHDALGRKWQLGTVQVDYVMPERFNLTFTGADNQKHRPVIIHRAPFGSMERFTSILIEHFAGYFPLWLSPQQAVIIPVSDQYNDLAGEYEKELLQAGIRVKTDRKKDQIGAKIRNAETAKIPYMLIIGEKEKENRTVSVRKHKKGDIGNFNFSEFLSIIKREIDDRMLPESDGG